MTEMQIINLFFKSIDELEPDLLTDLKEASRATLDKPMTFYVTNPDVTDAITNHPDIWFLVGGTYAAFLDDTDEPAQRIELPDSLGRLSRNGNDQAQARMSDFLRVLEKPDHTAEELRQALVPAVELVEGEGFPVDYAALLRDCLKGTESVDKAKEVAQSWSDIFAKDVD